MSVQQIATLYEDLVHSISELLERGDLKGLQRKLERHYPAEIALAMESLRQGERARLWSVLTAQPKQTVAEVMDTHAEPIPANMLIKDVVTLFDQRDLVSVAVVDEYNTLLGRISVPAINSMDAKTQKTILNLITEDYPWIHAVITIAPDGTNISRNDDRELKNYSERIYVKQILE